LLSPWTTPTQQISGKFPLSGNGAGVIDKLGWMDSGSRAIDKIVSGTCELQEFIYWLRIALINEMLFPE
jgi:hypothetical protein